MFNPDGTHTHLPGTPTHDHNNPATKNLVSRVTAAEADGDTSDPTTPEQAAANARAAAAQRAESDPPLTHVPVDRAATVGADGPLRPSSTPATASSRRRPGAGCRAPTFSARDNTASTPLYFKPTELGRYLLYSPDKTYLGKVGLAGDTGLRDHPGRARRLDRHRGSSGAVPTLPARLRLPRGLADAGRELPARTGSEPQLHTDQRPAARRSRRSAPTSSGEPAAGVTPYQEVRGYIDAHTHGMAFEFLGGDVHCGRPWHRTASPYALKDCPDHYVTGGYGAALEDVPLAARPHPRPGRLADVQGLAGAATR